MSAIYCPFISPIVVINKIKKAFALPEFRNVLENIQIKTQKNYIISLNCDTGSLTVLRVN